MARQPNIPHEAYDLDTFNGRGYALARFLSRVFNPIFVNIGSFLIVGSASMSTLAAGLTWAGLCVLVLIVPPTTFYYVRLRQGVYSAAPGRLLRRRCVDPRAAQRAVSDRFHLGVDRYCAAEFCGFAAAFSGADDWRAGDGPGWRVDQSVLEDQRPRQLDCLGGDNCAIILAAAWHRALGLCNRGRLGARAHAQPYADAGAGWLRKRGGDCTRRVWIGWNARIMDH